MAEPYPGLFGAVVARAEAQVLRIACLYALLDKTDTIDVPHLDAAYALWRYCEASARYIFGTLLGDPLADDIYQMLQQMTPDGITRTDISNAMGRHHKSATLRFALGRLLREGMARYTVDKTSGRPVETWFACRTRDSELSELSPQRADLNSLNSLSPADLSTSQSSDIPNADPQDGPQKTLRKPAPMVERQLPVVGDLVFPLAVDGSRIPDNGIPYPYLIISIDQGPGW